MAFAVCDRRPSRRNLGRSARQAAIKISRQNAEPSQGRRLLAEQEIFANGTEITSAELVQLLAADLDGEWCEYRGRDPITQRELAVLLREYDISPVVLHPSKNSTLSRHGYKRAQFKDTFAQFLPQIQTSEHQGWIRSDVRILTSGF